MKDGNKGRDDISIISVFNQTTKVYVTNEPSEETYIKRGVSKGTYNRVYWTKSVLRRYNTTSARRLKNISKSYWKQVQYAGDTVLIAESLKELERLRH